MLDYSKVVQLIKKELPSATDEEIDYMISTIPTNMPYPAVKVMIKLTKHLVDNPAKRELLKKLDTKQTVQQDASCGTQD